jgi:hypothetical protein
MTAIVSRALTDGAAIDPRYLNYRVGSRVVPLTRSANNGARLPLLQLSFLYLGCGAQLARTTVSNP